MLDGYREAFKYLERTEKAALLVKTFGPMAGVGVAGAGFPKLAATVAGGSVVAGVGVAAYTNAGRYQEEPGSLTEEHERKEYGRQYPAREENMREAIGFVEAYEPESLPDDYEDRWERFL